VDASDGWISKKVDKLAGDQILTTRIPDRIGDAAVQVTQPLTGFGSLLEKLKADSLTAEAARHDEEQSQADARLAGADAYIRAMKAERIYRIALESLAVIQKQRDDAQALERSGKLARVDVMRLEFSVSDAKTQLIQARAAVDVAAISLRETLGLTGAGQVTLKAGKQAEFESRQLKVPDLAAEQTTAQGSRPDLKSADKRIEAADAYKTTAAFDYLPQITGFTRFDRDFTQPDEDIPAIPGVLPQPLHISAKDYRDNLVVGVNATWVLWDWNTRSRRRGELAATADKAREQEEATKSHAHVEVATAHAELTYALQALESSRASLQFAEEVYRATNLKFKNGLATTTDLIEAERDQTRARATLANAQGDVDLAWLKLKRAAGERVAI
jgi:outer membrane protein TolC